MRWRAWIWLCVSLTCFCGAAYFWRLADEWEAQKAAARPQPSTNPRFDCRSRFRRTGHAIIHWSQPGSKKLGSTNDERPTLGAFVVEGAVPSGPVLLVDDVTDSRWTLTVLAVMLRQSGSGPVSPYALAKASPRGS